MTGINRRNRPACRHICRMTTEVVGKYAGHLPTCRQIITMLISRQGECVANLCVCMYNCCEHVTCVECASMRCHVTRWLCRLRLRLRFRPLDTRPVRHTLQVRLMATRGPKLVAHAACRAGSKRKVERSSVAHHGTQHTHRIDVPRDAQHWQKQSTPLVRLAELHALTRGQGYATTRAATRVCASRAQPHC